MVHHNTRDLAAAVARDTNRVIMVALGRRTGVENPNPYDYVKRMHKRIMPSGDLIYLDDTPLIWIGKPTFTADSITVNYRIINDEVTG